MLQVLITQSTGKEQVNKVNTINGKSPPISKYKHFFKTSSVPCGPSENSLIKVDLQRETILPPQEPKNKGKKTLVLDLDETLVHSSFQPVDNVDIVIPVTYF